MTGIHVFQAVFSSYCFSQLRFDKCSVSLTLRLLSFMGTQEAIVLCCQLNNKDLCLNKGCPLPGGWAWGTDQRALFESALHRWMSDWTPHISLHIIWSRTFSLKNLRVLVTRYQIYFKKQNNSKTPNFEQLYILVPLR